MHKDCSEICAQGFGGVSAHQLLAPAHDRSFTAEGTHNIVVPGCGPGLIWDQPGVLMLYIWAGGRDVVV